VEESKSQNYLFLKNELLPSLLSVLGSCIHEEYPQAVFQQAPVLKLAKDSELGVSEEEHVAGVIAGAESNFTRIKSLFAAFCRLGLGDRPEIEFQPIDSYTGVFARGRSAKLSLDPDIVGDRKSGYIGEISPMIIEKLGLKVPAAAFELNVEPWL